MTLHRKHLRGSICNSCCFVLVTTLALMSGSALSQQEGGSYKLHPSVVPGAGGESANSNTLIRASAAQHTTATSSQGSYSLEAGFWPNAEPCPFAILPLGKFLNQDG